MLFHILDRVFEVNPQADVAVVIGHKGAMVEEKVRAEYPKKNVSFVVQEDPQGTGHAVKCAMHSEWGKRVIHDKRAVLILPGDLPMISTALVQEMSEVLPRATAIRMLTANLQNAEGYGRVVRKGKRGPIIRVVEDRDANAREKLLNEVALSIYTVQAPFLEAGVSDLKNNNAQNEYYLPDLIHWASRKKRTIDALDWQNVEDVRGVNNPWELAQATQILNHRVVKQHAMNGVKIIDVCGTYIQPTVTIAADVTIYPGAILEGRTEIASGAVIGPAVFLKNVIVGSNAEIKAGTVAEDSIVESNAKVGPYAHLRPESHVGSNSKIGNFVELKKTRIGKDTSVAHLSYLGDAEVGDRVNIGCGFITCNFDGRVIDGQRKHRTVIEDDVFVGSDCQFVAPIQVRKGSYVASGSTITENVESDALAIARSRQVNKPGYAKKLRGNSGS